MKWRDAVIAGVLFMIMVLWLFLQIPGEEIEARRSEPYTGEVAASVTTPMQPQREEKVTLVKLYHDEHETLTEANTEPQEVIHFEPGARQVLKSVLMAECEGEDTEGKALVVLVIYNRMRSDAFKGTTVNEIVYAPGQFCTSAKIPNDDCEAAIRLVESGWDESQGALFFEHGGNNWVAYNRRYAFTHGGHNFYW